METILPDKTSVVSVDDYWKTLKIVKYPDLQLTKVCREISEEEFLKYITFAKSMIKLMNNSNGIGLAASQVRAEDGTDTLVRLLVIDTSSMKNRTEKEIYFAPREPVIMINPVIVKTSSKRIDKAEGCLSFPGIYEPVRSFSEITVNYVDKYGITITKELDGITATCIQHEIDHLNGRTIFDRVSRNGKLKIKTASMKGLFNRK